MQCLIKNHDKTGNIVACEVSILDFAKNPSKLPKEDLPLWRFVTLKRGAPLKACQDNYDTISALILEFDKGVTIQEIENKMKNYTYLIHTTSNHTATSHRFRIILPLDKVYDEHLWRSEYYKQAMIEMLPNLDRSTFVNYQKIPALPANPADYYYNINKGTKFGFCEIKQRVSEIEMEEELHRLMREAKHKEYKHKEINYDAYKAKVDDKMEDMLSKLPRCETGDRYVLICSAIGKILAAKYPDDEYIYDESEAESMIKGICWDKAIQKAFKSFARKRK